MMRFRSSLLVAAVVVGWGIPAGFSVSTLVHAGPSGKSGTQGARGKRGEQGAQGPAGPTGKSGPSRNQLAAKYSESASKYDKVLGEVRPIFDRSSASLPDLKEAVSKLQEANWHFMQETREMFSGITGYEDGPTWQQLRNAVDRLEDCALTQHEMMSTLLSLDQLSSFNYQYSSYISAANLTTKASHEVVLILGVERSASSSSTTA